MSDRRGAHSIELGKKVVEPVELGRGEHAIQPASENLEIPLRKESDRDNFVLFHRAATHDG